MQRTIRLPLVLGSFLLASFLFPAVTVFAADAPPEVDAALRARVQDFYQLQKDRKYREAEEFVAADTKDYYFNARKANIIRFRIVSVDYAPDLQSATVKLMSAAPLPIPGTENHPLDAPVLSEWKLEGGKWCWHVDPEKLLVTPLGTTVQPPAASSANPMSASVLNQANVLADVSHAVKAEPAAITIDAGHPQPQVVKLKNTLPGPVTIQLAIRPKGLNLVIAKPNLGANESTDLTISVNEGTGDFPRSIFLRVAPFGQTLSIPITWAPASK